MKKSISPLGIGLCFLASIFSSTGSFAQANVQVAQGVAEPQTFEVALDDGSTMKVEANYKVKVEATVPDMPPIRKMAIFIKNNVDKRFDRAGTALRNQVASNISGANLEILDYTDIVTAISPLVEDISQADVVNGQFMGVYQPGVNQSAGGRNTTQDEKLLANTSFTRLAENMGADYVLMLTLDSFNKSTRTLNQARLGGKIVTEIYKLSASYRVLDAYSGASIGGDTLRASRTVRQTEGYVTEFGDFADNLEEDLAEELAEAIRLQSANWREASLAKSGIPVMFGAKAYDMNNSPIYYPKYSNESQSFTRAEADMLALIEVDGITKGTTSCEVRLSPGIHKVRFSRSGYDDLVMHVIPKEGLVINASLRMKASEYERIKDMIKFTNDLTMEREINQAHVKLLEGKAKEFEQSGIKMDITELPEQKVDIIH